VRVFKALHKINDKFKSDCQGINSYKTREDAAAKALPTGNCNERKIDLVPPLYPPTTFKRYEQCKLLRFLNMAARFMSSPLLSSAIATSMANAHDFLRRLRL
jgi:hypothetical protein